jgi:outer membrane lipoprotein-sorting protein
MTALRFPKAALLPLTVLLLSTAASAPAAQGEPPGEPGEAVDATPTPGQENFRDERAQQVLMDAIEAMGGVETIGGRETIYIKRRITNYDYPEPAEGTITVWFKRPDKIRQEVAYEHRKVIRAFDGERAWLDDGNGPELLSPHMALMIKRGIRELDSPLLYLEGNLRYLSVAKDPRGRLTQKVSWRHEGYARDLMVDVATSHILVIGAFDTPVGAISRLKILDDYRPVQGLMIPHREEVYRNDRKYSETEILEAKFDLSVEDALFVFPGSEEAP